MARVGTQPIAAEFIEPGKLSYGIELVQILTDSKGRFLQNLLMIDATTSTLTAQSDFRIGGVMFKQAKIHSRGAHPRSFGMFPQFSISFATSRAAEHSSIGSVIWGETFGQRVWRYRADYADGASLSLLGTTYTGGHASIHAGTGPGPAGDHSTINALEIQVER